MRNETIAIIMVVTIVLAFLAGLGSSVVLLRSSSASQMTTSSTTSTQCSTAAAGQVQLRVVNSTNGKPIASAQVYGEVDFPDCSNSYTTVNLETTYTNATGFAFFGSEIGTYYLTVQAHGNYFVDVTAGPEQTTCVTLSIPSGEFTVRYSQTFQFTC
jgi:hypothetical protein